MFQVLIVEDPHDEQSIEKLDERYKEELSGPPNGVPGMKAALFNSFCQHLNGFGLEDVQRELWTILVTFIVNAYKTGGGKLYPWPKGGAEANPREAMFFVLIREKGDALGLLRHGHDELTVHHEPGRGVGAKVDVDQQVIVAGAQQTGHVLVLDGVEQLRLIHVAAQGMCHPVVPKSADGGVKAESVIVEF